MAQVDAAVQALFLTTFGREPDATELNRWGGLAASGASLLQIAQGLTELPDFIEVQNMSDRSFVQMLYERAFGREGDSQSESYWTQELSMGTTRAQLLANFSEMADYQTQSDAGNEATPLSLQQPAIALPMSMVTAGEAVQTGPGTSSATFTDGFIITTAFDVQLMIDSQGSASILTQALGQSMLASENPDIAAWMGNTWTGYTYGSIDGENFSLPNLSGLTPLYATTYIESTPQWGLVQGAYADNVILSQDQLPPELGGSSQSITNEAFNLGMQYLINVSGTSPQGYSPASMGILGMVCPYALVLGSDEVPVGFLPADGRLLQISDYEPLFDVLGTLYGGDGVTTFALPDLRNRVPIGTGNASDGSYIQVGQELGSNQISLTLENIKSIESIDTLQPSLALNYVVDTQGDPYISATNSSLGLLGQVLLFAGQVVPDGWVLAQGQALEIDQYQLLFSVIGNHYGGDLADGTFALPDLTCRTVIGSGGQQGLQIGQVVGQAQQYVASDNLPSITVPTPGLHLTNDTGQEIGDQVTGAFDLSVSGVWTQASIEFSSNGTTWSSNYEAQEGSNSVMVRQVDVLGQASASSAPIVFTLDTTAPEAPQVMVNGVSAPTVPQLQAAHLLTSPTPPEDPGTFTGPFTSAGTLLTLTSVEPGALVEFSTDGGVNWTNSFAAMHGLNSLQVRQTDVAGNVSEPSEAISFNWTGSDQDVASVQAEANDSGGQTITFLTYGSLDEGFGTTGVDQLIYGAQQSLVLPNSIENLQLTANGLGNSVIGNSGNNIFEVVQSNWVIDGKDGQDTVLFNDSIENYRIMQHSEDGQLQVIISGVDGRVLATNIESIEFGDATLALATGLALTEVDYLYEALLGRNADVDGLTHWVQFANAGASLSHVAKGFLDSPEFTARYGQQLSNSQFIDVMYEAILGRAPDDAGKAYWSDAISTGSLSKAELVGYMVQSDEAFTLAHHTSMAASVFIKPDWN